MTSAFGVIASAARRSRQALALAAAVLAAEPAVAASDGDAATRGAHLAAAAGCDTCHTDKERGGQPYAGGRLLQTEYGAITTPNLTPDKATGIGRWSAADFEKAMRWGVAPDDTHYVPVFPYPFYNRLTAGDLGDFWAFLTSLPPVARPDLPGAASPALIERAKAAVGSVMTPFPGAWRDDPAKDATWNRGAYLVHTIGRCGDCHTPRNFFGAPQMDRFLAGGPAGADGKKVPNVTPDKKTGIGNWSESDIVQVLTDGATPSFDEVGGSMVEIVKNTARLNDDDRRAIAIFLGSLPAVSTPEQK